MSVNQQRLLQAIENFQRRNKGEERNDKVEEAIGALTKLLSAPAPGRDTPGAREALKVAPGTRGAGEDMSRAAVGIDGPSPGQREARSLSQQIHEAAQAIVDSQQK